MHLVRRDATRKARSTASDPCDPAKLVSIVSERLKEYPRACKHTLESVYTAMYRFEVSGSVAGEHNPDYCIVKSRIEKEQGEVSERLKEHAWKVCIRQRIEGSNPSLTAKYKTRHLPGFLLEVNEVWTQTLLRKPVRLSIKLLNPLFNFMGIIEKGYMKQAVTMTHKRDHGHADNNPGLARLDFNPAFAEGI